MSGEDVGEEFEKTYGKFPIYFLDEIVCGNEDSFFRFAKTQIELN